MKTKILFVLLLLSILCVSFVQAKVNSDEENFGDIELKSHTINIGWFNPPSKFYEFTQDTYNLVIINDGPDKIKNYSLNSSNITIINFPDTCTKINDNFINCVQDIGVGVNGGGDFIFQAPKVDSDKTFNINITTTDNVSDSFQSILTITVLNDIYSPEYTLILPVTNHSILKPQQQEFAINYVEKGSGLSSINLFYNYMNMYGAVAGFNEPVQFNISHLFTDVTKENITLNYDETKPYVVYYYNLTDRAGNSNIITKNWIYLDNEKPTINLISPNDNEFINKTNQEFNFTILDDSTKIHSNFAPQFNCSLFIEGMDKNTTLFPNSTTYTLNSVIDYDDGYYNWNVSCTDSAGWSNISLTKTFKLDTRGPTVDMISHENNSVVNDTTQIIFNISDYKHMSNISHINGIAYNKEGPIEFNISSASLSYGPNTLIMTANDTFNNVNSSIFNIVMDNKGPNIVLNSPKDNEASSFFNVSATDDYSVIDKCILNVNGTTKDISLNVNEYLEIIDGTYDWNVSCVDVLGNWNISETRTIHYDRNPPNVTLISPEDNFNSENATITFIYNVTDQYLKNCSIYIDGILNQTNNSITVEQNWFNITFEDSNNNHSWQIVCVDDVGFETEKSRTVFYDTTTPNISNIKVSETTNTVKLSWNVSEDSNNRILFNGVWKNINFGSFAEHTFTGLNSNTLYPYILESCDLAGNCENVSNTITTKIVISTPPPTSSGGGSFSMSCKEDWECGNWSLCENGIEQRECLDIKKCNTEYTKPITERDCTPDAAEVNLGVSNSESLGDYEEVGVDPARNLITGQVTGDGSEEDTNGWTWVLVTIAGLVAIVGGLTTYNTHFK